MTDTFDRCCLFRAGDCLAAENDAESRCNRANVLRDYERCYRWQRYRGNSEADYARRCTICGHRDRHNLRMIGRGDAVPHEVVGTWAVPICRECARAAADVHRQYERITEAMEGRGD